MAHLWIKYPTYRNKDCSQAAGSRYLQTCVPKLAAVTNYINDKVWYEITYPFLNFNGCTVEV